MVLSSEKKAEIVAALVRHPNTYAVARQTGVGQNTAWRLAKQYKIELKSFAVPREQAVRMRAQALAALKKNSNARQVALKIGYSRETIRQIAIKAGIELTDGKRARNPNRIKPAKEQHIIRALQKTPNASAVARQIGGVSQQKVCLIAKDHHIYLPGRKKAIVNRPPHRVAMMRASRGPAAVRL